jgi:regulator of replication initiation timing
MARFSDEHWYSEREASAERPFRDREREASAERLNVMAKTTTRSVDLEPIDRLEEKIKALVTMVERMKHDQAHAAEENQRLSRELDSMRTRIASSDGLASELTALKDERDVIRGRVSEMLEQLEALNL